MLDEILISSDFVTLTVRDFFLRLAVTIGIGFVIGLEREYSAIRDKHPSFAGVRSFTLVTLLGFLAGLLSGKFGLWILYLSFGGLLMMVAASYYATSSKGEIGTTTEFTLIACFLLGILTLLGYMLISLPLTVIILALLSLKLKFKSIAGSLTQEEIYAFLKFVILVALILPFLPDQTIDPYHVFNPKEIMLVIILASGLNFTGYLLIKILGADKGILLTGIAGGFISSTAVTWVFAKKSEGTPALSKNFSAAIILASTVMAARVILLVYIFNKPLLVGLSIPLFLIAAVALIFSIVLIRKNSRIDIPNGELLPENPLNLLEALKFGALFTVILYIVHFALVYLGSNGILIASAISSLTDVDAITISLAKLTEASVSLQTIQNGILLAVVCNTLVKLAIALIYGSRELKKFVTIGYTVMFLSAILGFIIMNFL